MSKISVLSPDGQTGSIDNSDLPEALKNGYTLPENKVALISPNGEKGFSAPNEVDEALKNGFTLATPEPIKDEKGKETHSKDDILDSDHNVKLVNSKGEEFSLPLKDAEPLIASRQANFKDSNFQSLYEKKLADLKESPNLTGVKEAISGVGEGLIPGAESVKRFVETRLDSNEGLANHFALETLSPEYSGVKTVSHIGGMVGGILGTGGAGILGEGALAGKVSEGVSSLLPEATSALGRIGTKVLSEAAGGAAMMAPQAAIDATLNKDPSSIGETLGWGALAGGGLGLLMQGGSEALNGIKGGIEDLKNSGASNKLSDHILMEQMGLTKKEKINIGDAPAQAKLVQAVIDHIGPENMSKMSQAELGKAIDDMTKTSGSKLGEIIDKLHDAGKIEQELYPSVNSQVEKLTKLGESYTGPAFKTEKNAVDEAIEQLQHDAGPREYLDLKAQQDLKSKFQEKAYGGATDNSLGRVKKTIAHIFKEETDNSVERLVNMVDSQFTNAAEGTEGLSQDPRILTDYYKNKQLYGIGKHLEDAADRLQNKNVTGEIVHSLGHGGFNTGAMASSLGFLGAVATGHPIVAAGALAQFAGSKLVKHWARDNGLTRLGLLIRKNANSPQLGTMVAMDANKILESKLGNMIRDLAVEGTHSFYEPQDHIKNALGEESVGLSKAQQFNKLAENLNNAVSNPNMLNEQIGHLSAPIVDNHPEVGKAMQDALMKKIQFLQEQLPKSMRSQQPFSKKDNWQPSATELHDFNSILAVAENPFHVIDELKSGTLTSKQVSALSVMNPAILNRIREEILKEAYSGKKDMTYQQKLNVSLLMGQDMGTNLNNVAQFQKTYLGNQSQSQPSKPASKHNKAPKMNTDKMPGAQYTTSQRLASK